ncbi:DUF368 domain-containing protein [Aeromicrobium phragmitis]|uniref:DUF368 domain-containing protein n=1 Tax=Aeromicrobium phragmitis TaxID=2478914 RepID=A0A3L8PPG4_9ACTN|nr:DUF368 domain-containing protein [Aeromicrobium phragmitis]RLV57261.1 DUF368 domain-containing protein [Aeromicrobium phragmitis]
MRAIPRLIDAIRGALIGVAEIIPGVSGGTVALIVGVYETLIDGAGNVVRGVVHLAVDPVRGRGTAEARRYFSLVPWGVMLPVGVGMLLAVLIAARLLAPLVEDHPVESRAFFSGLILVSILVPARMVGGRWGLREWVPAILAAVAAFVLTAIPPASNDDPALWMVTAAAAVAICALVLPGVSGSFILLTLGLYEPTLHAVNDRDLPYIAAFAIGAILGLGAFVQVLRWLLHHRRRLTLAIMTGLMAGSLRALWPWQSEDGALQSPSEAGPAAGLFVLGALVVLGLLMVETVLVRRRLATGTETLPAHADDDHRPTRS